MKQHLFTSPSAFALKCALVFSILFGLNVSAQTYPVQTNISSSGPYLNYLSYYGDDNNHLQLTVTQLDFNEPPILARLRIRIEGPGYELYTNPNATVGQPFLLDAGMPLTITGIDLLPYLQQGNLINPSGVDLNNLPHGFTTVCVDVIRESASQQVLSTNNCGFLPIQEYQPPQTFIPTCGDVLDTNTMFHTFTWTPPVPFPAGVGLELLYDFSIYQWADPNNNSALNGNSILIYQQNDLIAPTTQVSDFDVIFELGRTYVWKVTARVESNGMPINLIENGGVSAPCTFIYGEAPTLNDVLADGLEIQLFTSPSSERKGKAWWTVTDNTPNAGLSTFDAYFVEYRKQPTGNEGFEIPWFSKTLSSLEYFIYQLEPSTAYEVKVSGVIAGTIGDPTPVETFTTPAARVYNCGESDVPYLPTNYTPLENATAGTQVKIGQFMMTMTEVTAIGSAGHYKGKGEIPIAFLANAKAKVRFDDILIDTEYLVHEGRVDVITEGLANWLDEQYQQFIDPYFVEGTIDSAYVQDSVAWVVVDGIPQSFNFDPPNYPIIVNDESGNQYTIYPNGTIVVSSYLSISETWAATADEVIHFTQSDSELRGFDPKEHMEWFENYEVMELGDSSKYFVANKSLAKGEADKVNVEIPSGATASFELSDGTAVPSSSLQGSWIGATEHTGSSKMTLDIPARSSSGNYSIYALVNGQKVGQLNVKVYSQKDKELVVVPLVANSGISEIDIENELRSTLGEANIEVDVTLESPWVDSTGTFTASTNISMPSEVGLLSKYSDDMRELRDAYFEQHPSAPKNKYYLFLVNGFDDPNELGYMVRGRSMGFVKVVPNNSAQVLQTISHELGHGMGALEHTFKDDVIAKGSTNNLMDYSADPTNLTKAQWKELRDLDIAPSLFDEVEDAELFTINGNINDLLSSLANADSSFTFLAPSGKPITIKGQIGQIKFASFEDRWYENGEPIKNSFAPIGCLVSFTVNGEFYNAYKQGGTANFVGFQGNSSIKYKDTISRLISVKPILVLPTYQPDGFFTTAFKLSNAKLTDSADTSAIGPILNTWDLVNLIEGTDLDINVLLPTDFSSNFSLSTLSILNDLLFTNYAGLEETTYHFYGYEAVTIYNTAYYIENIPNAQSCYVNFNEITKILTTAQLKADFTNAALKAEMDERNEELLFNQSLGIYQDGTTPLPMLPPFEMGEIQFYSMDGQQEYQSRRLATALSGIRYYNQLISDFSSLSNLSDVDFKILIKFSKTLDSIPGLGDCLFLNISPESKVALLNRITDWTFSDGKEEFLLRILENTTDEQFALMYNDLLSSDCKLLHNLTGGFWYSHYDRFSNRITQLILNYKNANSASNSNSNLPTMTLYHDGINPFDSEVECDFDDCTIAFDAQIVGVGNNISGSFHPADLVQFIIEDDFEYPGYNGAILEIGDTLIAPAFWGYYFLSEHDQQTDWQVFRYFAEAALIIVTSGSAAPEIIQVELAILGADIVIKSVQNEYPNNAGLNNVSYGLDALSVLIPITSGHAIIKNGIKRIPWISSLASSGTKNFLFYQDEFTLFLRAIKEQNKVQDALSHLSQLSGAILNSNLITGAKQTLLNYLTVAELEIGMLKYTPDPYKARLLISGSNTNFAQIEIYQSLGNYGVGSKINIGNYYYDGNFGSYVYSNLQEYDNIFGNVMVDYTGLVDLKVLENGILTTKSYRVVLTESGNVCLKVVSGANDWLSSNLITKLDGLGDALLKQKFIDDFANASSEVKALLNQTPDLIDSWKVLSEAGVTFKTDVSWLTRIDNWKAAGASTSDLTKLTTELGGNNALKTAFEADEILFAAWKNVEDGIPALKTGQPATYIPYMRKMSQYMNEKAIGGSNDLVTWYRVQGGQETQQSWNQVTITQDGSVFFVNTNSQFNFSSKTLDHAVYFQSIRPDSKIYSWKVPKWFDDFMKENAIPQWGYTNNVFKQGGQAPQIADPTQVGHAFTFNGQLDEYWYPLLRENTVPGSGVIID